MYPQTLHTQPFAFGLWLWLYMFLVVGVSHGILIAHDTGLCDAADEHSVSAEIHIVFYLQGHESIDIFVQEYQAVVGVVYFLSGKFIGVSAGLEAELLKTENGASVDRQFTFMIPVCWITW